MLVFLHPMGTRELETSRRLDGSGMLRNTIGNPLDDGVLMGPLINEQAVDGMLAALEQAKAQGGEVILGGDRHLIPSANVFLHFDNEMLFHS